jgi:hypothetical protein
MKFNHRGITGEYTDVYFDVGEYKISKDDPHTYFIDIQPQGEKLEILDGGSLTLWPLDGVSFEEIEQLAAKLRDSIKRIQYQNP